GSRFCPRAARRPRARRKSPENLGGLSGDKGRACAWQDRRRRLGNRARPEFSELRRPEKIRWSWSHPRPQSGATAKKRSVTHSKSSPTSRRERIGELVS